MPAKATQASARHKSVRGVRTFPGTWGRLAHAREHGPEPARLQLLPTGCSCSRAPHTPFAQPCPLFCIDVRRCQCPSPTGPECRGRTTHSKAFLGVPPRATSPSPNFWATAGPVQAWTTAASSPPSHHAPAGTHTTAGKAPVDPPHPTQTPNSTHATGIPAPASIGAGVRRRRRRPGDRPC